MTDRSPTAVRTISRRLVDFANPNPDDIVIDDIAHSLARQCRYNGHTAGHLSVARHSIWVSEHLAADKDWDLSLWGLLHDAAEAYLGDVVAPIKRQDAMAIFRQYEEILEQAIAKVFDFPWPMPEAVKEADFYVATELEIPHPDGYRYTYHGSVTRDQIEFIDRFNWLGEKRAS